MPVNVEVYRQISAALQREKVTLVAVSKTKSVEDIRALYDLGQRDFGENYVQELVDKAGQLPNDIRWHFIGHLQRNKVKYIVPIVHLIHGVDSFRLLEEINRQSLKFGKITDCLLQIHIASEETKFGMDESELRVLLEALSNYRQQKQLENVSINGLMGMASFTDNMAKVRSEFQQLKHIFDQYSPLIPNGTSFKILSMGMSSDYLLAVEEGSTMVRIGSLLFGERVKASP